MKVLTAGGLISTGTRDRKVRALDSQTGRALWEAKVDAAVEGEMPALYKVGGREYIVFCAAAQATTRSQMFRVTPRCKRPTRTEKLKTGERHCISSSGVHGCGGRI